MQTGQGIDGTPHCFSGEGGDQVGEPQNPGKASGRELIALFIRFCQVDKASAGRRGLSRGIVSINLICGYVCRIFP